MSDLSAEQQLLLAIGRMEGKLDSALVKLTDHDADISKLDDRMRKVEQGNAKHTGVVLGASAAISAIISILSFIIGRA